MDGKKKLIHIKIELNYNAMVTVIVGGVLTFFILCVVCK